MNDLDVEVSTPGNQMAVVEPAGALSLESAFRAVVEGTIKAEHVAVMKELLAMDAIRKFNAAFVVLQSELPAIQGFRGIPDKQGNIKFVYANFDDIDAIIRPICLRNGFTYSFSEEAIGDGRVRIVMTIQHCAGHSIPVRCSVRIGSGPPGANEQQCDMSAHTYGKRGCVESGFSLRIIGDRDDARMEGDPGKKLTPDQAFEIERRVKETNSNVAAVLKFCGAASFSEIQANKYSELDNILRQKENVGKEQGK